MQFDFYTAPNGCSRVAHIALETSGHPYDTHGVYVRKGANRQPEYLALNPSGKLPLLIVNGRPLAQNVAILTFLARAFPHARLLPLSGDPFEDAQAISPLVWCASDLHPMATRFRLPMVIAEGREAHPQIKAAAEAQLRDQLTPLAQRLEDRPWFFGDHWSIVDSYLAWICFRLRDAGFPVADFGNLDSLMARADAMPATQRALSKEADLQALLDRQHG